MQEYEVHKTLYIDSINQNYQSALTTYSIECALESSFTKGTGWDLCYYYFSHAFW